MNEIPEFVVDIEPGWSERLRLSVQASGLAPITDEIERALPAFPPADLDELRSGAASERVVEAIANQVTSWLLQRDLRGHLATAFNAAAGPIRIVIRLHHDVLADLAEVPFELVKFDADPLVLMRRVRAVVHMQKRPRAVPPPAVRSGWPFNVLLVRTNPPDLGGKVPPIVPLRERIRAIADSRGLGRAVGVTVLSSEAGADGAPTYDALRSRLRKGGNSALVYLGHGDLLDAGFEGLARMGVLQFELGGSAYANPVRADQLRSELQNHPVPLVVLAGCLTAASVGVERQLPQWMRGSQNVAETLIYEESGVQCTVGMRYRLETEDADRFLGAFFQSLLDDAPGDVEQAVRAGREDLFAQKPYPPSWSAPAIFRTSGREPMFEWMRRAPGLMDPLDEHEQKVRAEGWKALSSTPCSASPESRAFPNRLLEAMESAFVDRWTKQGASVLWPTLSDATAGGTAHACVTLGSPIEVSSLEGRLTVPDPLRVQAVRPAAALRSAGFRTFFSLDQPGSMMFLLRGPGGSPAVLPAGALVELDLEVPAAAPAVYDLSVDGLESDPPALLRGWNNAIVVSPP